MNYLDELEDLGFDELRSYLEEEGTEARESSCYQHLNEMEQLKGNVDFPDGAFGRAREIISEKFNTPKLSAKDRLIKTLEDLGYKLLVTENGDNGRTFDLYLHHPAGPNDPIKMILVMDHPGGKGFEIFHPVSGSLDIESNIEAVKKYTTASQMRPSE